MIHSRDESAWPAAEPPRPSRMTVVLVVLLALTAHGAGIWLNRLPHFFDDASFFFRYAESLARGGGLRWNAGEEPVWGASAPLWALVLGGLTRLGLTPESAALGAGWVLTLVSAVFLALTALRCVGFSGAVWCILLGATNWRFCAGAVQGMESPVAYLLVSAGLLALSGQSRWPTVGVLAGLSLVHKIDFAPFGFLLLAGLWIRDRRIPWRDVIVAAGLAAAWYSFAWVYFGSPLPNSFLTKLNASYGRMDRDWFATIALLEGGRLVLVGGAVLALPALWSRKPVLLGAGGLIVSFVAGYTLKPPPEGFVWYQAPVQPALILLAGCGIGAAMESLCAARAMASTWRVFTQVAALAALGVVVFRQDRPLGRQCIDYVAHFERDRSDAGRWIDAHAAPDATLLTGFGNIAYYAHRRTIDTTFLNRRPPLASPGELIAMYRPEFVAFCPWKSGVAPDAFVPLPGYRVATVFDSTRRAGGDFYVVVMAREDLASVVTPQR